MGCTAENWNKIWTSVPVHHPVCTIINRGQPCIYIAASRIQTVPSLFTSNNSSRRSYIQCESKTSPLKVFWQFFPNSWGFLVQILHIYFTFPSILDYKLLSNCLKFWQSYAILNATTEFTPHVQNVHHRPKSTLAFSDIIPKQLGIFGRNFTHLLYVPTYARFQFFPIISDWRSYAMLSATT